jgi:hypothetical protein
LFFPFHFGEREEKRVKACMGSQGYEVFDLAPVLAVWSDLALLVMVDRKTVPAD